MNIVVYPHSLKMGGSQLNAIELAAAVRDRGHDVVVFGIPGPLVTYVEELGLEFVEAPRPHKRPSLRIARALRDLSRVRNVDILHGYEWPPALESLYATRIGSQATPVTTVMSMSVAPFIPRRMALVAGTQQIVDHERPRRHDRVSLIEPPVDMNRNRPGSTDAEAFRREYALDTSALTVVVVSRLVRELKLEGLLAAVSAIEHADKRGLRAQLVMVGDGTARQILEDRARDVNIALDREAVILTGQLDDPRPAYAAADVVVGAGGSALKALAFGKPLVVQGERGFWKLLTPESAPEFLWHGWYGYGANAEDGAHNLTDELVALWDEQTRKSLGEYGHSLVAGRFSLENAARLQEEIYESARASTVGGVAAVGSDLAGLARYSIYYARKRFARWRGREVVDDFNARPVAAMEHQL